MSRNRGPWCPRCDNKLDINGNHDRLFHQRLECKCRHCRVAGYGYDEEMATKDFKEKIGTKRPAR